LRYIGQWKDGFYEGEGILEVPGISKYEGRFEKGIKEGRGTLNLANGVFI